MEKFAAGNSGTTPLSCKLYGVACKDGCLLVEIMRGQAETGGSPKPGDTSKAGPIVSRDSWDEYMERTETEAQRGCSIPEEVGRIARELTEEKEARGDFLPD